MNIYMILSNPMKSVLVYNTILERFKPYSFLAHTRSFSLSNSMSMLFSLYNQICVHSDKGTGLRGCMEFHAKLGLFIINIQQEI
jgi:hypothetical protein